MLNTEDCPGLVCVKMCTQPDPTETQDKINNNSTPRGRMRREGRKERTKERDYNRFATVGFFFLRQTLVRVTDNSELAGHLEINHHGCFPPNFVYVSPFACAFGDDSTERERISGSSKEKA